MTEIPHLGMTAWLRLVSDVAQPWSVMDVIGNNQDQLSTDRNLRVTSQPSGTLCYLVKNVQEISHETHISREQCDVFFSAWLACIVLSQECQN